MKSELEKLQARAARVEADLVKAERAAVKWTNAAINAAVKAKRYGKEVIALQRRRERVVESVRALTRRQKAAAKNGAATAVPS